jgi:Bifunctional DNA primase/polymerase, N-terminal
LRPRDQADDGALAAAPTIYDHKYPGGDRSTVSRRRDDIAQQGSGRRAWGIMVKHTASPVPADNEGRISISIWIEKGGVMESLPDNFFGRHAETIVDNGYSVVPVLPGTKKPRFKKWQTACFKDTDSNFLTRHVANKPTDSVGLACGTKITAIDIDETDPVLADQMHQIAREELGYTPLVRYGEYPRRVLVYRTGEPMDTARFGKFDVLGRGGKFVAFGIHPGTGKPYFWPEDNPSDTDIETLPAEIRGVLDGLPAPRRNRFQGCRQGIVHAVVEGPLHPERACSAG